MATPHLNQFFTVPLPSELKADVQLYLKCRFPELDIQIHSHGLMVLCTQPKFDELQALSQSFHQEGSAETFWGVLEFSSCFYLYPESVCKNLEFSKVKGAGSVEIKIHGTEDIIIFASPCIQLNSNKVVRRLDNLLIIQPMAWSWANDSSGATKYSENISNLIEKTYLQHLKDSSEKIEHAIDGICIEVMLGIPYVISFKTMKQMNMSTGYQRDVYRSIKQDK